jgi:hypothetical protein
MAELTRDLVRAAPQVTNALQQRELSLRGAHIAQLPVTDPALWADILASFDHVDLSDNVLQWLDAPPVPTAAPPSAATGGTRGDTTAAAAALPRPTRLSSIALHNNVLRGIARAFAAPLRTTLTSIVLHNNQITELADCDIFAHFEVLQRLSLKNNPVQSRPHYRLYLIGKCAPTLKLLDFARVRDAERRDARALAEAQLAEAAASTAAANAALTSSDGRRAGIGGGQRAARKAALAQGDAAPPTSAADDVALKRPRGAADRAMDPRGAAASGSLTDRVGAAIAQPGGRSAPAAVAATRAELMAQLDAATSMAEMDRIEALMKALDE